MPPEFEAFRLESEAIRHDLEVLDKKIKLNEAATRIRVHLAADEVVDLLRVNAKSLGVNKRNFKRYEKYVRRLFEQAEVKLLGEQKSVWREDFTAH